jgi:hypothetical protein
MLLRFLLQVNRLLRICLPVSFNPPKKPYIVPFEGEDIKKDYGQYLAIEEDLRKETGQPVMRITGADSLTRFYSLEAAANILEGDATRIREEETVGILLLKPGYEALRRVLAATAEVHLKVTREHGALIVYCIKPRTGFHAVEVDTTKGVPLPKMTAIT